MARCCCPCSTWPASRATTTPASATSRARCGVASPTVACVLATPWSSSPAANVPRWWRCDVATGEAGQSVGVVLDRQLDVSRGDWIGTPRTLLPVHRFGAMLAWLDTEPAVEGRKYLVRHGHRWVQTRIASVGHRLDIHTLAPTDAHELAVNDIGQVVVELQQPLPLQTYADNRVGGALIVVDPASHRTSGALLVQSLR
jgi:sulfate adenylyltransferase subunit 1 (EFTu-like GTPase family)